MIRPEASALCDKVPVAFSTVSSIARENASLTAQAEMSECYKGQNERLSYSPNW